MISILLYGRNDSHGYNLHKRAAISLNCIAQVLNDPDDEILFVDYNTPDDMPTFVEAIQDTLTKKAKKLIRVLRVRPKIHQRFKNKTHLVALEPISRNAAVRRSNPANRWLLSTNTDMVFVPGGKQRSLSDIAVSLEDGFYHLPRFELPECLWESFDRLDPKHIIRTIRDWGVRFHLNDVVYMNDVVIYDGPGDFQLMLREDAFAVHGFHEEMIVGWHVDSNLAKRMKLFRGEVKSALPLLYGYHCDHTRQATLMHGRGRIENDLQRFFFDVTEPGIPAQQDNWGLAGEDVEELRLSNATSQIYVRALQEVLPAGTKPFSESFYTAPRYNDLNYDAEHVFPYLCDLLSTSPRQWNIGYAGCRGYAFELFCKAFHKMGFTGRIVIPETFTWLMPPPQAIMIDRVPFKDWLDAAHQFVFEFGLGTADELSDDQRQSTPHVFLEGRDKKRLAATSLAFHMMVGREREVRVAGLQQPRRVLAVNVIHNEFEALIRKNLSYTYTPYSSRTRHGHVIRQAEEEGDRPAELRRVLLDAFDCVDKGTPFSKSMLAHADQLLSLLKSGDLEVLSTIGTGALLRQRLRDERPSANLAVKMRLPPQEQASNGRDLPLSVSRICDVQDWENESWLRWIRRFSEDSTGKAIQDRRRESWERASFLYGFDTLGLCAGDKDFLVIEKLRLGEFVEALYGSARRVDVVEGVSTLFSDPAESPSRIISMQVTSDSDRSCASPPDALGSYDAIVLPRDAVEEVGGMMGLPSLLKRVAGLLRDGGIIAFAAEVCIGGRSDATAIDADLIARDKLVNSFHAHTNLEVLGPFRKSISLATLDCYSVHGTPDYAANDLVTDQGAALISSSVWFLRKKPELGNEDWQKFTTAVTHHQPRSLMWRLYKTALGTLAADGYRVSAREPSGFWVYGPYLRLPAGFYHITVDCLASAVASADKAVVVLDVVLGETLRLAIRPLWPDDLAAGPIDIVFEVPPPLGIEGGSDHRFEIRLRHLGRADLHLRDILLAKINAEEASELVRLATIDRSLRYEMVRATIGRSEGDGYAVRAEEPAGFWLYGPYLSLPPGYYHASFECRAEGDVSADEFVLTVDILLGAENQLAVREYRASELQSSEQSILFEVPIDLSEGRGHFPFEIRFHHLGRADLHLRDVWLTGIGAEEAAALARVMTIDHPVLDEAMRT